MHRGQLAIILVVLMGTPLRVEGDTFNFGGNQNSMNGSASKLLVSDGFRLQLDPANPSGAFLNEPDSNGLGIDSHPTVGFFDPKPAVFNMISGSGPFGGTAEALVFSFDRPGILTGINFDGVKDEALEYFVLETAGRRINLFDSFADISVPRAVSTAVTAGHVTGDVVYLLEISDAIDDEAQGLSIPFVAGQQFTLTYAELPATFGPTETGNGARLQGITVTPMPEPAAIMLALCGIAALLYGSRRRFSR